VSNYPPCVWLFTDAKPGHQNQLRGLAARLSVHTHARCHWLTVAAPGPNFWRMWRGVNPAPDLPKPDMLIAAGSATHRHLLAAKRALSCPAVVLMRPNFPYRWLDAALVPAHDRPPSRTNVLVTRGVLNAITPVAQVADTRAGLVLLGGPSQHYHWDTDSVVAQLVQLCTQAPDWRWTVADSRRTPKELLPGLAALGLANLSTVPHASTNAEWLPAQLASSGQIWVSPDSVSMVYEALTSGVPTGILNLQPCGRGRVVGGIQELVETGQLQRFGEPVRSAEVAPLWEADRAALWLQARFFNN
jgi:uncharacterized protein